mmetsp:Transcript_29635/g.65454  ORF Transcript_29635/g.65454 Transcript_29635/m.65454 type:complete len:96 (+) Transcript_29635:161-448(+)
MLSETLRHCGQRCAEECWGSLEDDIRPYGHPWGKTAHSKSQALTSTCTTAGPEAITLVAVSLLNTWLLLQAWLMRDFNCDLPKLGTMAPMARRMA